MAKKFSFRLEPLLNLRSHKVKEAKEQFIQVQSMRLKKENEISDNNNNINSLFTQKQGSLQIAEIQANFYRQKFLTAENERLENDKIRLLEIENHRRNLLAEAMKDEKILEKLKTKKKEEYFHEMNKEEVKFLDEIAGNKFFTNNDNIQD